VVGDHAAPGVAKAGRRVSVLARSAASAALDAVVQLLADHGITASRDPGAFHAAPLGVLVGLPALVNATLGARVYEIPVYVVSSDPLSGPAEVDALYALADDAARALNCDTYRPADWRGAGVNAEPLPAVLITAVATVPIQPLLPGSEARNGDEV
jgi:hypothetical protein